MEPITLEQAKRLTHGTILYHRNNKTAKGAPQKWRVSGNPQTWKRSPEKVSVPIKNGLYSYSHLTENNLYYFSLNEK
jgi:hypothetical protein